MPYGITIIMKSIGKMKRCEGYADCASSPIKEGAIIEAKKETEKPKTAFESANNKTQFIVTETFNGTKSLGEIIENLIIAEAKKTDRTYK